jgi:hypothetical protein
MNRKERMYAEIEKHGRNLQAIFNLEGDPVKLCKKLHSLEAKARVLAVHYCNGTGGVTSDNWGTLTDLILDKVDKVIGFRAAGVPVFVNGDARGYALKIKDSYMRDNSIKLYSDWGGYGILAPDFDGK